MGLSSEITSDHECSSIPSEGHSPAAMYEVRSGGRLSCISHRLVSMPSHGITLDKFSSSHTIRVHYIKAILFYIYNECHYVTDMFTPHSAILSNTLSSTITRPGTWVESGGDPSRPSVVAQHLCNAKSLRSRDTDEPRRCG